MRRTQIILEDDRDGGEADETVTFTFEGVSYEIDLNKENVDKFSAVIHDWARFARVTGTKSRSKKKASGNGEAAKIRAWAKEQQIDVPARGRIPQEVKTAYYAGH